MGPTFAILMLCFFGVAWVLGWWRMQNGAPTLNDSETSVGNLFGSGRLAVGISICVLMGLICQSIFMITEIQNTLAQFKVPSGWFVWGVLGSWALVAALVLQLNHRRMHVFGLFVLPIAVLLFGVGYFAGSPEQPQAGISQPFWRWIHSGSLLMGTVTVVFAFTSGALYMIQSNRLKNKRGSVGIRLPSLEKLQAYGERCLLASSLALALGLVSGIIMNLMSQSGTPIINWSHPVVWTSSILLCWLVVATLFNVFYQPARYGRKVAYLTIASGLFLALELAIVLISGHGAANSNPKEALNLVLPLDCEQVWYEAALQVPTPYTSRLENGRQPTPASQPNLVCDGTTINVIAGKVIG